nr:small heat shock protein [Eunice torquata]
MFRQVVPRVMRNIAEMRPLTKRYYCGRSRWVPVRRRFFDDFWPSPLSRVMDRQMNQMWKTMDDMSRFWEPYEYGPAAARGSRPSKDVQVKYTDQVFEVRLDVNQFAPEELNIKVGGERLTITGKQQERPDEHGVISREFMRQFAIPENVETESFESQLTTDGFLVIKGKVKGAEDVTERVINITREEPAPAKEPSKEEGSPNPAT